MEKDLKTDGERPEAEPQLSGRDRLPGGPRTPRRGVATTERAQVLPCCCGSEGYTPSVRKPA
jgi:hypothetical protein